MFDSPFLCSAQRGAHFQRSFVDGAKKVGYFKVYSFYLLLRYFLDLSVTSMEANKVNVTYYQTSFIIFD